jgi:aspartyl-tRNA(Asn)/glutamyl-tRNA(Gln) amidotransferase subunit A
VEDLALVLEVISGSDDYDSTVSQFPVPSFSEKINLNKKLNIGVIDSFFNHSKMNQEIRGFSKKSIEKFEQLGHNISSVDFSMIDYLVPAYYVMTTAEASSNLSRYDGIKFGYRSSNNSDLESLYTATRSEGFGIEVKRRIMLGTFVLSSGYYDAYFEKAQKIRTLIKREINSLFEKVDVLAIPISMDYPWKIGDSNQDPVTIYLSDVFTVIANICGIPAISLPIGKAENNLSSGIQLLSKKFHEQDLFDISFQFQSMA